MQASVSYLKIFILFDFQHFSRGLQPNGFPLVGAVLVMALI
jgi:hypothetical protein